MKTCFLLLLASVFCFSLTAQQTESDSTKQFWHYIQLYPKNGFGKQIEVSLDYGQARQRPRFENHSIADSKSGEAIQFNSMMDALNFMSELGWELAEVATVTSGTDVLIDSSTFWVMKRLCRKGELKKWLPTTVHEWRKAHEK